MNTVWSEWYHQDRFLGKPYPFIDNIPRPEIKDPDGDYLDEDEDEEDR